MDTFLFFQICLMILYLTSKYLLLLKKKMGWIVGFVGALLSVFFYTYVPNPEEGMAVLEAGTAIYFIYGAVKWYKYSGVVKKTLFDTIFIWTAVIAGVIMVTYKIIEKADFLVFLLLTMALFIAGAPLIAQKKALGWIFYAIAHIVMCIWMYEKSLLKPEDVYYTIFFWYQIFSATICIIAFFRYKKTSPLV